MPSKTHHCILSLFIQQLKYYYNYYRHYYYYYWQCWSHWWHRKQSLRKIIKDSLRYIRNTLQTRSIWKTKIRFWFYCILSCWDFWFFMSNWHQMICQSSSLLGTSFHFRTKLLFLKKWHSNIWWWFGLVFTFCLVKMSERLSSIYMVPLRSRNAKSIEYRELESIFFYVAI